MMPPPFALSGYIATISGLAARGYEVRSFHDVTPHARHLVLRHDVDQSIRSAQIMAEAEAEKGWRSTWFVLVRTEMYNPLSRAAAAALRAMQAAGHEIGLHLDPTYYASESALQAGAALECRILEDIVGAPVRIVSFHRPTADRMGAEQTIAGRPHTYMPRFTREMGYCSDSRGQWRHGHPFQHRAVAESRALQLLTHAVWWVGPDGRDARGRLADVLAERAAALDTEMAENNEVWQTLPPIEGDDRYLPGPRVVSFTPELFAKHSAAFLSIAADVPGEYWEANHFRLDLPAKWQLSFALITDAEPISYAIASRRTADSAHLHHFMVRSAWRGKGLAHRMMRELEIRCRASGLRRLSLKVPSNNLRAQRLYAELGFSRVATAGAYIVLEKALE